MSELTKFVPPNLSIYSSESIRRKAVGLTIRKDLLKKARECRINLSKLLETSLIQLLSPENTRFSLSEGSLFAKRERPWCSGRDLNPGRWLERPLYLTGLYYRSPELAYCHHFRFL
jgi:post-segregation antitoxin (ccd killing protein)